MLIHLRQYGELEKWLPYEQQKQNRVYASASPKIEIRLVKQHNVAV